MFGPVKSLMEAGPSTTEAPHLAMGSKREVCGHLLMYSLRLPPILTGDHRVGEKDTAFVLEKGATLRNVIIGKTAGEGVYCLGGGCNIEFVWFEDVCEDAISIVSDS